MENNEIVLFRAKDGAVSLPVRMDADTVWLTQAQMALLFDRSQSVIARHINHITRLERHIPALAGQDPIYIHLVHLRVGETIPDDDHMMPVRLLHPSRCRQRLDQPHARLVKALVRMLDLAADRHGGLHALRDEDVVPFPDPDIVKRIPQINRLAEIHREDLALPHQDRMLKVGHINVAAVEQALGA